MIDSQAFYNRASDASMKKYGAFFAFSNKQFEAKATMPASEYCSLLRGMCCPKKNAKALTIELLRISDRAREIEMRNYDLNDIVRQELANHEAYWSGDAESTFDALAGYPVERDQVDYILNTGRNIDFGERDTEGLQPLRYEEAMELAKKGEVVFTKYPLGKTAHRTRFFHYKGGKLRVSSMLITTKRDKLSRYPEEKLQSLIFYKL